MVRENHPARISVVVILECSNGASATLTRAPGRGAPVYLADLKNPDDTRLTSVYIHTNLPDARREVEERIIRAA